MKNLLIIFTFIMFYSSLTQAQQAGSLDLSFDGDGKVSTDIGIGTFDEANKTIIQPDGKIVVFGTTAVLASGPFNDAIIRLNIDGSRDNTFGQSGKILPNFNVTDIVQQADGKIVAVGQTNANSDFYIVRYNVNGTLDNSFSLDGIVTLGAGFNNASNVAIQSNGKIVVVGSTTSASIGVIRLNTDGNFDLSFDSDGKVTFSTQFIFPTAMKIKDDGKIFIAGYLRQDGMGGRFTYPIITYCTNGGGKASIRTIYHNVINSDRRVQDIALDSEGNPIILVYNWQNVLAENVFVLFRFDENLIQDNSLGNNGILYGFGSYSVFSSALAIQSDDKIVVGVNQNNGIYIVRYEKNGGSNASFSFNNGSNYISDLQIQKDGKFLIAGSNNDNNFALVRLHGVSNFTSNQGKIYTQFNTNNDVANAIAMRAGGKPIVVGNVTNAINPTSGSDFGIVAYNANGGLDYTFGSNAFVSISFDADDRANAVAVQTNDKILVAGKAANGSQYNLVVVRYNANGTLDNTFGISGIATLEIDDFDTEAMSIAIQTDGKIVVTGLSQDQFNGNFYAILARFNTNGFLDNTFGTNGVVDLPAGNGYVGKSVAIQSDGKIVIACASQSSVGNFVVIRCNANGSADNTFDTDGKVSTNVGTDNSFAKSLVLQSDGKIVVCGAAKENSQNVFAMLRYTTNGSLDNSFDADGIVLTNFSPIHATANAVAIQPDGKIFLTGNTTITTNADMVLARYSSDGVLDQSFNYSGKLILPFGYGNEGTNAMISNANGTAYLAGFYHNGHDNDFAMVKIVDCMQYIDVTLENPSNNYPNSLLPNPVYGKSINASNFINATSNVTYKTNSSVILNPGFQANIGSVFKTETGGCAY